MDEIVEILTSRGMLRLRPEREDDEAFRFGLFCDSRPDLAMLPVAAAAREQIMMMQFRAQAVSYRTQFPHARFDIIEMEGRPIGRIAVDRSGTALHIVDQALMPQFRNLGIGSTVMRALMDEAVRTGRPLRLHVASNNEAALRLYVRLGFTSLGAAGAFHTELEWHARDKAATGADR